MRGEVLLGVVVAREDCVRKSIDFDVSANGHVGWGDEGTAVVDVLVLSTFQEFAFDDARVLLSGLVNRDAVISQVEGNNESAVNVLRHTGVEAGRVSEDLLVIVDTLEEVTLGLVWHKLVDVAEGVSLVTEAIVWWDNESLLLRDGWLLDRADWELVTVLRSVEVLGEFIDASDLINSTEGVDDTSWVDLVAGEVVIPNKVLAWLVHIKSVWKFLSSQEEGEGVTSVIWAVGLSDLDGVIGQVVVEDVWQVLADSEESEHLSVFVQELLLGGNFAATEALFKVLQKLNVSLWSNWNATVSKRVLWTVLCIWELSSLFLEELSGEGIAVVNAELATVNANVEADAEIAWHKWALGAILLQGHLPLEEGALRRA